MNQKINDKVYNLDYILVDYRKIYDKTSLRVINNETIYLLI
jgi:hypothetical protein